MFAKNPKNQLELHTSLFCLVGVRAILFILMILSIEIYSQMDIEEYQINHRIGDEINRQERDYFFLFPDFIDFEAANFY